jgi:DNA transformation protein
MKSNLSQQINIGKDTEAKLIEVGINSFEELKAIGAEQAYIRLHAVDPGACLSLLCGLEGAIQGISWHKIPKERKEDLKALIKMANKQ